MRNKGPKRNRVYENFNSNIDTNLDNDYFDFDNDVDDTSYDDEIIGSEDFNFDEELELNEGRWVYIEDDEDDEPNYEDEYPEDKYDLVGTNGNIFAVMGTVSRWMRQEKCDFEEIERFCKLVKASKSYDEALGICIKYTDMCNELYRKRNSK